MQISIIIIIAIVVAVIIFIVIDFFEVLKESTDKVNSRIPLQQHWIGFCYIATYHEDVGCVHVHSWSSHVIIDFGSLLYFELLIMLFLMNKDN